MFDKTNLKDKPYISNEIDLLHTFIAPPEENVSCSDWLMYAIEQDEIEKIYAMRVLPFHDLLAFKIQYKNRPNPESEIISRPELCLLKRIWDCGNEDFNKGIRHYIIHSKHAMHQISNKQMFPDSAHCHDWYMNITFGRI